MLVVLRGYLRSGHVSLSRLTSVDDKNRAKLVIYQSLREDKEFLLVISLEVDFEVENSLETSHLITPQTSLFNCHSTRGHAAEFRSNRRVAYFVVIYVAILLLAAMAT